MNEFSGADEIVTINGNQYSRLMAEEMARDIELLASIGPSTWAVTDNSSILIDHWPALSFAVPVKDGYLVSLDALDDRGQELAKQHGLGADSTRHPDFVIVYCDELTADSVKTLRPGHEAALQRLAGQTTGIAPAWKWHNFARLRDVETIVGRTLPLPGYHEQLLEYRAIEPDMFELSGGGQRGGGQPGNPNELLSYIADAIEAAHETNANSWSIYNHRSGLILSISGYSVAFIANQRGDWMLYGRPDDEQYTSLSGLRMRAFDGLPVFRVMVDERPQLRWVAETFHDSFLQAVNDLSTRTRTITPRAGEFQSHVLEFLANQVGRELPQPGYLSERPIPRNLQHVKGRRYWTVDCGTAARDWPLLLELGRCAHDNWSSEPIYLDQMPNDHDAFIAAMIEHPGIQERAAEHCWRFIHEISPGDLVVAINSQRAYGWGEITGDYEYVADNDLGGHQRTVDWTEELAPHSLANMSPELRNAIRGFGPKELSFEQFFEAIGGQSECQEAMSARWSGILIRPLETLHRSFAISGLRYTERQIAAFYTALQTKGFVVLSGISGTGKSKIATGLVHMLPGSHIEVPAPPTSDSDEEPITFEVRPYMRSRHQIRFAKRYLERFPLFTEFRGTTVPVVIGDTTGTGNLRFEFIDGRPNVSLWMHRGLFEVMESWALDDSMIVDLDFDDENENVICIRISSQKSEPIFPKRSVPSPNHLFLAVRPDWRDSTSLLGYYNPLTQAYEWTDFLRFIIRAGENYNGPEEDRIAWFVILDEMNLAHVEYYFADLLSVIESGRDAEGWTAEPLRLTYPDTLDDEAPPRELRLPPNLYIIGTVNMDETTHAFSPKVLDRAFTIELTDVDFRDYPPSGTALDGDGLDDETKASLLRSFSRDGAFARINKGEIAEFVERHPVVRERLQALNDVLRPFRMHFGYRVFDEITQYLANNEANGMAPFEEAFDQAVFMKVLPKFSGSRARLLSPLHGVFAWAIDPEQPGRDQVSKAVEGLMLYESGKATEAWEVEPAFPRVAERVRDMIIALERDGFVSFG